MVAAALPDPLVPAEVDLRSFDWFPFKHKILRRSTWWLRASDQAKAISIELWCASYEEVPAGSLPDDDMALSDAVGFGRRDLTQWLAVKDEVMAAWTLCSDGRWYHPTLCEVAYESWVVRENNRELARDKKRRQRAREKNVPGDTEAAAPRENEAEKPAGEKVPGDKAARPRRTRATPQDITEHHSEGVDDLSVGDGAKSAPLSRATRISLDWIVSDEAREYALRKGIPAEEVDDLGEAFFTYWRAKSGKDATKTDWLSTWQHWVLNTIKWKKERGHGPRPGTDRGRDQHQDRVGAMLQGAVEAVKRHQGR